MAIIAIAKSGKMANMVYKWSNLTEMAKKSQNGQNGKNCQNGKYGPKGMVKVSKID